MIGTFNSIVGLLGAFIFATANLLGGAAGEEASEPVLQVILVASQSRANKLLERLKGGEAFEDLAKEFSVDPTAAMGGHLGKVKLSDMRREIREALKGIGPGELSNVFRTPGGYMILKALPEAEQLVAYVSGFEEVMYFFSRHSKPIDYHQDLRRICETRQEVVRIATKETEEQLPTSQNSRQSLKRHHTIAQLWAYQGNMGKAIEHFGAAYRIAAAEGLRDFKLALQEKLAIAHMRKGEVENCVQYHNARSCIFPLSPEARHKLQDSSKTALSLLSKYLRIKPEDLEVRWLLNLASMTLGTYPASVPRPYRILPSTFESQQDIGRFIDVAPALNLDQFNTAGGTIMDDFDNDGLLDIVISAVDVCKPMHYYHNNGDGTFSDWTDRAKLSDQLGGINLNHADYNNDGWLDIFVMRGGWEFPMRNSLLRNNADGTFTDVTGKSGLAKPAYPTSTAAWGDFDHDGWIDLFVANENAPGQLFRNNGDGTFKDVARRAGVDRIAYTKGAVWGDYDNDGLPDLYVSNHGTVNFLYHNNGDGGFIELARQLGVQQPLVSFPVWFFDYDNDGWLDLFVSSYIRSVAEIAAEYLRLPTKAETLKLYRNTGKGTFDDVTKKARLERISMAMGANFGDVDNDGFLDFYLGTGSPSYAAVVPNLMFRNNEGRYFVDITASSGTGHLQKGHGIAFGDIDHDGDQDIFLHTGGATPGDAYGNVLFENPGHDNSWIGIRLVGRKTNRAAIGARIKVTVETDTKLRRSIYRDVTSGGSFGSSSFQQNIGVGKVKRIESLEIWWPRSDTRQVFHNIRPNQLIEIQELAKTYRKLDRQSFVLSGQERMGQHH